MARKTSKRFQKIFRKTGLYLKHLDLMHRYGIVLKEKRTGEYITKRQQVCCRQFEKTTVNLKELLLLSNSSEQQDK